MDHSKCHESNLTKLIMSLLMLEMVSVPSLTGCWNALSRLLSLKWRIRGCSLLGLLLAVPLCWSPRRRPLVSIKRLSSLWRSAQELLFVTYLHTLFSGPVDAKLVCFFKVQSLSKEDVECLEFRTCSFHLEVVVIFFPPVLLRCCPCLMSALVPVLFSTHTPERAWKPFLWAWLSPSLSTFMPTLERFCTVPTPT